MKMHFLGMLAVLACGPPASAAAAVADIAAALEQQRQHGFSSPQLAIRQLTVLRAELASAPIGLRMEYHNALASLSIGGEQPGQLKEALG